MGALYESVVLNQLEYQSDKSVCKYISSEIKVSFLFNGLVTALKPFCILFSAKCFLSNFLKWLKPLCISLGENFCRAQHAVDRTFDKLKKKRWTKLSKTMNCTRYSATIYGWNCVTICGWQQTLMVIKLGSNEMQLIGCSNGLQFKCLDQLCKDKWSYSVRQNYGRHS